MKFFQYINEQTIQNIAVDLDKKGYKLGRAKTDLKKKTTSYLVRSPNGKEEWLTTKEILKL